MAAIISFSVSLLVHLLLVFAASNANVGTLGTSQEIFIEVRPLAAVKSLRASKAWVVRNERPVSPKQKDEGKVDLYLQEFMERLHRKAIEQVAGLYGNVKLSFYFNPNGSPSSVRITESSGDVELDDAIAQLIKEVEPMGAPPSHLKNKQLVIPFESRRLASAGS